jgi:hypothetical protein
VDGVPYCSRDLLNVHAAPMVAAMTVAPMMVAMAVATVAAMMVGTVAVTTVLHLLREPKLVVHWAGAVMAKEAAKTVSVVLALQHAGPPCHHNDAIPKQAPL